MSFSSSIRENGFWLQDRLQGDSIRKHLIDISCILERPGSPETKENVNRAMTNLLRHVTTTTPYYKKYINRSLKEYPVIDKTIIRESGDAFLSEKYSRHQRIPNVTSGSTGTPFQTYQNINKKLRNSADTIYFAGLAGYEIGQRLIYLKIWAAEKMRRKAAYWLQNIVPVDVIRLDDCAIEALIRRMEGDRSVFGILGYASALELICRFLDSRQSGPVKADVRSIIAMSESLNDYTKATMEKYFGVPVVSRYSNLENGIIAQQERSGSGSFLINTASYHVEILKIDSDDPASDDEPGRIVVTDLFNYAMPMIRYDTGDIGVMEKQSTNSDWKYLSKVEGRKLDLLYDTRGRLVSSYIAYKNMWKYLDIKQYQLIQEGEKEYTFKINAEKSFNRGDQLIKEFKHILGFDADFKIEYVDEIPLLASGKRKKTVNKYKPGSRQEAGEKIQ
ncbi:MAG: CoF synthetase [Acidobacteriota bacterium]|nr:CoF synthetase [Acidobacteriota bacterium]